MIWFYDFSSEFPSLANSSGWGSKNKGVSGGSLNRQKSFSSTLQSSPASGSSQSILKGQKELMTKNVQGHIFGGKLNMVLIHFLFLQRLWASGSGVKMKLSDSLAQRVSLLPAHAPWAHFPSLYFFMPVWFSIIFRCFQLFRAFVTFHHLEHFSSKHVLAFLRIDSSFNFHNSEKVDTHVRSAWKFKSRLLMPRKGAECRRTSISRRLRTMRLAI